MLWLVKYLRGIVAVIGRGSNQRKLTLLDDVCQVSDESALSIYERGPKVSAQISRSYKSAHALPCCGRHI